MLPPCGLIFCLRSDFNFDDFVSNQFELSLLHITKNLTSIGQLFRPILQVNNWQKDPIPAINLCCIEKSSFEDWNIIKQGQSKGRDIIFLLFVLSASTSTLTLYGNTFQYSRSNCLRESFRKCRSLSAGASFHLFVCLSVCLWTLYRAQFLTNHLHISHIGRHR